MQSKNEKILWADNLRAFATISVIFLHVSAPILHQYGTISTADWSVGNFIDGSMRISVPLFLMLTGALLFSKTYQLSEFLKKRVSRIILPFLFWCGIYIFFNIYVKWTNEGSMELVELSQYIFVQFRDGPSDHLWYIYLIIGIYLVTPIVSKWIIHSKGSELTYFLVIWIIVILLELPFLNKFKPNIELSYFSGFLGYPILGYLLMVRFNDKNSKVFSLLLLFFGTAVTITGTYFYTKRNGYFTEDFYSYLTPNVIIASIGAFLFIKQLTIDNKTLTRLLFFISKYSYGIFLSHIFVIILLSKVGISWSFITPMIGVPITAILCLLLSLAITFILSKIPYGRYISG